MGLPFNAPTLQRSRYLFAIASGLLLACAFLKIGLAGAAWVGPGLILACAIGKCGWEAFRIGYVAGLAFYLAQLYWLLCIPYRWHGIPLGPAAGWLALSGFLALFPGTWVWVMCGIRKAKDNKVEPGSGWSSMFGPNSLPATWAGRSLWTLSGAAG